MADSILFTTTLKDGRKVEVKAAGTVYPGDFYQRPHVEGLHCDVYLLESDSLEPIDPSEITEWDSIEQDAVNQLCEEVV